MKQIIIGFAVVVASFALSTGAGALQPCEHGGHGQNGPTTVVGTSANDTLEGCCGPDKILGKSGDDRLWGGRGPDILNGGPGFDRCHSRGRGSNDTFISCEVIED